MSTIKSAIVFCLKGMLIVATGFLFACEQSRESAIGNTNPPVQHAATSKSDDVIDISLGEPFQVEINGLKQRVMVHTNQQANPLLLVLHGGPGYAMLPMMHQINPQLEDEFTVVNWDQRGAGRSPETDESKMTLAQIVDDAHQLTLWLKQKFGQQKIYIMGHSFGTVLGLELIRAYPEDYLAFVGVGQTVNVTENEQYSYDWALQQAQQNEDEEAIALLTAVGRINDQGNYPGLVPDAAAEDFKDGFEVTSYYVGHFGGDRYGADNADEYEQLIVQSGLYREDEWNAGWTFSQRLFDDPAVWRFDAKDENQGYLDLEVPVYFFMGQQDYDTPVTLFETYYALIRSKKAYVKFELSAHFPFFEEPETFRAAMIQVKQDMFQ